MPLIRFLLTVLLLGAGLQLAACNDVCEFRSRCSAAGDAIEGCVSLNDGPSTHTTPCKAPNAACASPRENLALCVRAPATPCDETFTSRCEGTQRVYCNLDGFESVTDCASLTLACAVDPQQGGAVCR